MFLVISYTDFLKNLVLFLLKLEKTPKLPIAKELNLNQLINKTLQNLNKSLSLIIYLMMLILTLEKKDLNTLVNKSK